MSSVLRVLQDEGGQDLVEYSLLLALLAFAAIVLLSKAGGNEKKVWTQINSSMKSAATAAKKAGS